MKDHRTMTRAKAKKGARGRPGYERPERPRIVRHVFKAEAPACPGEAPRPAEPSPPLLPLPRFFVDAIAEAVPVIQEDLKNGPSWIVRVADDQYFRITHFAKHGASHGMESTLEVLALTAAKADNGSADPIELERLMKYSRDPEAAADAIQSGEQVVALFEAKRKAVKDWHRLSALVRQDRRAELAGILRGECTLKQLREWAASQDIDDPD